MPFEWRYLVIIIQVREEALKHWIASSASTVGVTTFLGVLEGGAMHYFVSEKGGGGADKKIGVFQRTHRHFYPPTHKSTNVDICSWPWL